MRCGGTRYSGHFVEEVKGRWGSRGSDFILLSCFPLAAIFHLLEDLTSIDPKGSDAAHRGQTIDCR